MTTSWEAYWSRKAEAHEAQAQSYEWDRMAEEVSPLWDSEEKRAEEIVRLNDLIRSYREQAAFCRVQADASAEPKAPHGDARCGDAACGCAEASHG